VLEAKVLETILAFLAGLLIGSFLNVCIFRLPRDLSVMKPARSFCPACEKTIVWHDNLPIASYLMLGGRCRHCKQRISSRYPIVELLTGIAFAICIYTLGPTLLAVKFALFSAILITLIVTDIEERILPDEFTLGGTALGLVLAAFVPLSSGLLGFLLPGLRGTRWLSVSESALGAIFTSGCLYSVGWMYQRMRNREGLGLGDVKMIAMIGSFLGIQWVLMTLIIASLMGSIGGLLYIFITRKDASTYELPFGSFLGIAALFVAIYSHAATL
jgi:leader peptidase (prepilin peptidase)/N-methyltransferase